MEADASLRCKANKLGKWMENVGKIPARRTFFLEQYRKVKAAMRVVSRLFLVDRGREFWGVIPEGVFRNPGLRAPQFSERRALNMRKYNGRIDVIICDRCMIQAWTILQRNKRKDGRKSSRESVVSRSDNRLCV